jgi:hypothetical protein
MVKFLGMQKELFTGIHQPVLGSRVTLIRVSEPVCAKLFRGGIHGFQVL